jgi:diphthine synthase
MALFLIGLGLGDADDITLKGLGLARKADKVYLEIYTSLLNCSAAGLEKVLGKKLILADRELVEQKPEESILEDAKAGNAALLVPGDPLAATTHADLLLRARKAGIPVKIVHNASILSAVGETGLQLYKFGKTASIPFAENEYMAETPYDVLAENRRIGAHTLVLLDLRPDKNMFMTVNDAIDYLLKLELKLNKNVFTKDTPCIGCARIGAEDRVIRAGKAKDLQKADFGKPVHCLIVPGKMHFIEEEFFDRFRQAGVVFSQRS